MILLYRVKDWNDLYENNRSRAVKELEWVPVPNRHDGEGYSIVMEHPRAAEIYTAWHLILQVASRCQPRGSLLRPSGTPHTPASLALKTRGKAEWFELALTFLSSQEVGWLEVVEVAEKQPIPPQRQETAIVLTSACQSADVNVTIEGNGMEQKGREVQRAPEAAPKDQIKTLRDRLNTLFKRSDSDRWSYNEETAMVEVFQRATWATELDHILEYRSKMPFEERKRFFPQSLLSLLSKWTETLDKARLQSPRKAPKPPAHIQPPQQNQSDPDMIRESIRFMEIHNPNSPLLQTLRNKLAQLDPKP
jgi:hypothetical protein